MEKKIYLNLKTPISKGDGEFLNKLKITIDYQKGGINYIHGEICESGVYVYITPCTYENGIVGRVFTGDQHKDGYKIMLKQINRNSQKQIDLMAEKVMPYAGVIASLYSDGKHRGIYNLIKSIV